MKKPQRKCPCCGGTGEVDDPYEIGISMRRLRESKSISLREVARRMDKSAMFVSHLERGMRNWNDALIADYRKALK
jgi:transcriptional regulator with XRE-family HTH domain